MGFVLTDSVTRSSLVHNAMADGQLVIVQVDREPTAVASIEKFVKAVAMLQEPGHVVEGRLTPIKKERGAGGAAAVRRAVGRPELQRRVVAVDAQDGRAARGEGAGAPAARAAVGVHHAHRRGRAGALERLRAPTEEDDGR